MSTAASHSNSPTALRQRRRRARLAAVREIEFVRADWALFLHPDRLPQKAGCPRDRLRAMVLKELVDNALDAGANAALDQIGPDTWVVTDDGPGLDREQIVRLFAVNRPMTSTKLVRRPTRGAMGNGLRVVTGGVLASGVIGIATRPRMALPSWRGHGHSPKSPAAELQPCSPFPLPS